jgi:hypothetical protein|tara:strand:- start:2814 stop:3032 length:219 start_codon:yes stop_codon:yes gene_type:complete
MSVLLFCILHKLRQFLRFGCVNIVSTDDDDDFEIEKRSSTTQTVSLLLCRAVAVINRYFYYKMVTIATTKEK